MVPSNLPPAVGRDKEGSICIHHATSQSLEQHTVYGVIFHTGHTWEPSKRPCSESWEHGCSHQKLVRATLWDQLVFLYLDFPLLPHHHQILICVIFISFPWIKLRAERERDTEYNFLHIQAFSSLWTSSLLPCLPCPPALPFCPFSPTHIQVHLYTTPLSPEPGKCWDFWEKIDSLFKSNSGYIFSYVNWKIKLLAIFFP